MKTAHFAKLPIMLALLLTLRSTVKQIIAVDGMSGTWELLLNSSGVVAMHMALTHLNTVVLYDQTSSGRSAYHLPRGLPCPSAATNAEDRQQSGCWAHSMEYDVATNTIRPLSIKTDTWCSSGSFLSDGTLQQNGGYKQGARRIRYFRPCADRNCDWNESSSTFLAEGRWYATNQVLPDDERVIIVGGLNVFSYEFIPKSTDDEGAYGLPFLHDTHDPHVKGGNNLYPFVHLSSDGNLFIFANRDSILFDYRRGTVLRTFPRLPGDGSRNYPSTGSSVMLPLEYSDKFQRVEVMVCGGSATGAFQATLNGEFYQGLSSCGRMVITGDDPNWEMEDMPGPRLMSDMLLLPTGDVLLINGATHGCAGWEKAINPVLAPYLYKPKEPQGRRFSVLRASEIPRMYHSTALLLADGRVLVGGSNPYFRYNFSGYPYATELRLEAFTPHYMGKYYDEMRPTEVTVKSVRGDDVLKYGELFTLRFQLGRRGTANAPAVEVVASAASFVTHSLSMHQRMLKLECVTVEVTVEGSLMAFVRVPTSPVTAPAGYYMLTVLSGGIPSKSKWVRFVP